jgi:hypothetical protein
MKIEKEAIRRNPKGGRFGRADERRGRQPLIKRAKGAAFILPHLEEPAWRQLLLVRPSRIIARRHAC